MRSITAQIEEGASRLRVRHGVGRFIAYFQPSTNTYAPVAQLRALYEEALSCPGVVGLAIGTRPDCVPDDVLDLLAELAKRAWLVVEYGLQSMHARSLAWMHRGHDFASFLDAVARSRKRGLAVGCHAILGIPGETRDDMLATAKAIAPHGLHSIKLHNLYAVRDTRFGEEVLRGEVRLPSRDEHVGWVCDFLEQMPPGCVVDRISGDAPREYLIGPDWCLDKDGIRKAVSAEFRRRGTRQGTAFTNASP
jgi:radical SAM protein (TIGR01212 family)